MNQQSGFTLIELMIAAAIIGVLAMIAVPKFSDLVVKAKEAAIIGKMGSLRSALKLYYADTEGETPLLNNSVFSRPLARYLDEIPAFAFPNHRYGSINPNSTQMFPNYAYPHPNDISNRFNYGDSEVCEACATSSVNRSRWYHDRFMNQVFINCEHLNSRGIPWSTY